MWSATSLSSTLLSAHEYVEGLDHPILDGAVSNKTISNRE
jgi:hypothetical protein